MKKTSSTFDSILNTIYNEGITTKEQLSLHENLYSEFWFAARNFSNFTLLSKTSTNKKTKEVGAGNAQKVDVLVASGITTKEDVLNDCVIKLVSKLDLILKQPLKKQKNYCYVICNNVVNDQFRKLPPQEMKVFSLQDQLTRNNDSDEDSCTYEELIGDNTYNGESLLVEKETISELSYLLRKRKQHEEKQKALENEKEKQMILKEMILLSKKPSELLVHMACSHLEMKPRMLTNLLIEEGCVKAFATILSQLAEKFHITADEFSSVFLKSTFEVNDGDIAEDSKDSKKVASQVSRLVYRAKKSLQ